MTRQFLQKAAGLAVGTALALGLTAHRAQAQTPINTTIRQIQFVSAARLAACDDRPRYLDTLVRVQGIVITPGGQAQSASGRQIWIRDVQSGGEWNSLGIRFGGGNTPTTPNDILALLPGDTIEVTGRVEEFLGGGTPPALDSESQINPNVDGIEIIGAATGPAPQAELLPNAGVLNNTQRVNNLPTGEAWEGAYVELRNVTVVSVVPFSNNTRVSFTVRDAAGNQVEISDRFLIARPAPLGNFVAPNVGDQFTYIRGIVIHSKNGCPGTGANNRGYTINPFRAMDYGRGASAPSILGVTRAQISPCSTDVVTITASITDVGGSITQAQLFYAVGETNNNYVPVTMTSSGGDVYTAQIPAQSEGVLVKYYLQATDNDNNTTRFPAASADPIFYTVRCGGPTIRDIQYTPFTSGASGYRGLTVQNIEGVVTASAQPGNLGQVFIQQPGLQGWAGIWVSSSAQLATLQVGNLVRVSGTVDEYFNFTRILATDVVNLGMAPTPVTPLDLPASVLSTYTFAQNEQYEGMLVRVIPGPTAQSLFVVDTNVRLPSQTTSNFAEWRVGPDPLDPTTGVVLQTGRQDNSNFSSLNVSYINNLRWTTQAGTLAVPPIRVNLGDRMSSVTGIVYYGFNTLKMLPRNNADFSGYVSQTSIEDDFEHELEPRMLLYPNPAEGPTMNLAITDGLGRPLSYDELVTMGPPKKKKPTAPQTPLPPICGCPPFLGILYAVVFDPIGRQMGPGTPVTEGVTSVPVDHLPKGIYYLQFINEKTGLIMTERFVR